MTHQTDSLRRRLVASLLLLLVAPWASSHAAEAASQKILVFGGTGHLGSEIVQRLLDHGHEVTVFARPGSDRARLQGLPVRYVEGDLLDAAGVAAAFEKHRFDTVVLAVRVRTRDIHFYEKILPPIVAGAKAAGVRQIIHHGAVGAGRNLERFAGLGWEQIPGLLDLLKDQGAGEDILRAGGVPWTIIRNGRVYPVDTPATGKAALTEDDSVLTPMTRADLAILTLGCLGNPDCIDKTFHVRDTSLPWPAPGLPPYTAPE